MNAITVEMVETPAEGAGEPFIEFVVMVDGEPVKEFTQAHVDVHALAASTKAGGEFFIGNCGCGEPQCAGIPYGVQVDHEADRIRWRVPVPYRPGRGSPKPETFAEYAFESGEYRRAVGSVLVGLESLAAREAKGERFFIDCCPGMLARQLLGWIEAG